MADTFRDMKCPACQKTMKKIFEPKEGVNVDICTDGCGGIFFDNREFKYFDEQHEPIDNILDAIEGKEFEKVDSSNHRSCPACGARMAKHFASCKHEVEIDECYSCGGKFLDRGELRAIRVQYKTESDRSQDMMNYTYATVGVKVDALREKTKIDRENRPLLRRFFDKYIF